MLVVRRCELAVQCGDITGTIHNFGVNSHLINLCGHDVGVYTSTRELHPLVGIDVTRIVIWL